MSIVRSASAKRAVVTGHRSLTSTTAAITYCLVRRTFLSSDPRCSCLAPPSFAMLPSLLLVLSALYALLPSTSAAPFPLTLDDPRIPGVIDDLSGSQWTASSPALGLTMPAHVPGDLITDLFNAQVIPEPLYELNWIKNASIWNDNVWYYNRTHSVSADRVASLRDSSRSDDLLLVFDGIKMGADIYVNGVWIARSIAQFERHIFSFRTLLANKTTTGALQAGANTISVVFNPAISTDLFMQCTGGWDWAPYSNTTTADGKSATFSRGIWKSVYMAYLEDGLAVTSTTPLVTYRGPFPTMPLSDGNHGGFTLNLTMQTMAVRAISANLTIQPSWRTTPIMATLNAPAGVSAASVYIDVSPEEILLWWPTGLGAQPLYDVDISIATASVKTPLHIHRRIGFRYFAIVTGNDTDDDYVQTNADVDGTDTMGMRFCINGAPIFARGANIIPMDNMEGRYSAAAHRRMVWNARDGGMNIMRIWGGGVYLPSIFYATADEVGVMVYHDLMNRDYYTGLADEVRAYQSQVRRLATHPSIVIWDGCNECDANQGQIGTTVMTVLTNEDSSRAVWPSCPAQGWRSGVNRLSSHPDGMKLNPAPASLGADVNAFGTIEQHGPYQHGDGWPAVNGDTRNANQFDPMMPLDQLDPDAPVGLGHPNLFTSEFGSVGWSSFESVAPTIAPNHWALHGGAAPDNCDGGGWPSRCIGENVMSQRNYPCDSIIFQYFGGTAADLEVVGEMAFKKQLFQCLYGQALVLRGYIEQHRSTNTYGLQIWQLNEIWPTGRLQTHAHTRTHALTTLTQREPRSHIVRLLTRVWHCSV